MKEMYDSEVRTDTYKLEVNSILREMAIIQKKKGKAVILDSDAMVTRDALLEAGYKKCNINIPNPFSYKQIKKKHERTYDLLLNDYLDKVKRKPFTFAFFDYCGSLNGNETIKPREDIRKYFKNKNPTHDSIFAVTVSIRQKNDRGPCSTMTHLISEVTSSAQKAGYTAVLTPLGLAYHGMYFAVFKIY